MRLSVIVSTYNQPDWLELVLWGLSVQTQADFELLIADDGSDARTRTVLDRLGRETTLCPLHVWHEDRGFQKCAILNRAIRQANGEYILLLDGDCIPRSDFVEQHCAHARAGRFLSGGAVRLTSQVSHRIRQQDVLSGQAHRWGWLRSQGLPCSSGVLKLLGHPAGPSLSSATAQLFDRVTTTKPTFNGGNASAWRADLLRVNGFDERMGHGGLDRELGERLENAGIVGRQVRHRCVCVHLDHPRGYASAAVKALNDRLRARTRQTGAVWTSHGIEQADARAA